MNIEGSLHVDPKDDPLIKEKRKPSKQVKVKKQEESSGDDHGSIKIGH